MEVNAGEEEEEDGQKYEDWGSEQFWSSFPKLLPFPSTTERSTRAPLRSVGACAFTESPP